ncbi:MAG: hypothetical protein OXU77_14565, partial [Gammaproteobacteria bacterium]|nr:hypothetical protein [Gammaproteobacteria bacterium]
MHVGAVATSDVKRVLRHRALAGKHATMRMVAGRIVAVLEWAEVENLCESAGSGRAIVETVTRSLPKAAAVRHHRSLDFSDVADAHGKVDGHPSIARSVQLAIRFGVPTAARQAECAVRPATSSISRRRCGRCRSHMKRYRPHRVPLSTGALDVSEESRNLNGRGEFAFRALRGAGKLGGTTVADALRKADINAAGHGFRSSFKDWARHEGVDE